MGACRDVRLPLLSFPHLAHRLRVASATLSFILTGPHACGPGLILSSCSRCIPLRKGNLGTVRDIPGYRVPMSSRLALGLRSGMFVLLLTIPGVAYASPVPLSQDIRLGKPVRSAPLGAESSPKGLFVKIGSRSHTLAMPGATDVSVETIAIEPDGAVNVLRAKGPTGELVALFGGKRGDELLLSERADFVGDPGERTRTVVEARDVAGKRELVVGIRHEAVALCGGHEALFARRTIDPKNLTLVSAQAPALSASDMIEVQASPTDNATSNAAGVLRALDAVSASPLDKTGPLTPTPPLALVDGNAQTAWTSNGERGEFALLRWRGKGFPIERMALVPPAEGPGLPRSLWLLADATTLHVSIPATERGAMEILMPKPLDARCLALVIDEAGEPGAKVSIAEVHVSTSIEREGGVDRLVALLVQDDPRADDIASALGALGPDAAARVAARYEELSERGKRRALRVLLRHLELDAARSRVLSAARSEQALRDTALAGLRAAGEQGKRGLRELSLEPTEVGDTAASWLAREAGETGALLRALGSDQGASRPPLREALIGVARRESAAFDASVSAWLDDKPSVAARVALAFVLSRTGQHADRAAALAEQVLGEVTSFEDRYRLALALAKAGPSSASDAWLDKAARSSDEWMMRRVAYEALQVRDPGEAASLAAALVTDPYPRVRASALQSLVTTPARSRVETRALEDKWPLVRVAAVRALTDSPDAKPTLRKAVDDTSRRVRSAAIEALAGLSDRDAWSLVQARLVAPGEWPEVHAAAMRFAGALCIDEAREPLLFSLRRAIRADASEDEVRLGVQALRALHELGGQAAADAALVVARDGAPPGMVRVAQELPSPRCTATKPRGTP